MIVFSRIDTYIPTLPQGIVLLSSIISAAVYLFLKVVFPSRPKDKHGNAIPDGPIGLPIIGPTILLLLRLEVTL
jgi:hypothetical protein